MPKSKQAGTEAPEGLPTNQTTEVVDHLRQALADTAVAQMKAQHFHWNVTGMSFGALHELFEKIYKDHFEAADEIAERMRALGVPAEGRFETFVKNSHLKEANGQASAEDMVAAMAADERHLSACLRRLAEAAESNDDIVTNDMAVERAGTHDKFAWMLAAHIQA